MFLSYDIIIVTETWLTPDFIDSELGLYNFKIFRLDRNPFNSSHSRGGGVLIYYSIYIIIVILNLSDVEQVFAILSLNSTTFLIGSIYLPPLSSPSVIELHFSTLDHLLTTYKPNSIIIFGDYNLPGVSWSFDEFGLTATGNLSPSSSLIMDYFSFLNFFNLITCVIA